MFDVIVVGAGMGGIYAVHRLRAAGLDVLGVEAAADVGGVWYHNRYPGARVDVDSTDYCFLDPELYRAWSWQERYATQPELLHYLNFAADHYGVRTHFRFNTRVTGAVWDPTRAAYELQTTDGSLSTRFLVMATGPLSQARTPEFDGLDTFAGQILRTSQWPREPVDLTGKRVAVIGTGSSGIQTITALAPAVEHLYVMQRTANWSIQAGPMELDPDYVQRRVEHAEEYRERMLAHPVGIDWPLPVGPAGELSHDEQQALLEARWKRGGAGFLATFTDTRRNPQVNELVAEFVRAKIREKVHDPAVVDKLLPTHPIGTRRICIDTGYFESFNRDNVTLVDVAAEPIQSMTPRGIKTESAHYDVDVVVLALGFEAFRGSLDAANIRNVEGRQPGDVWREDPYTYLGLMTTGFPNLFHPTGPGSPSVAANMNLGNVVHLDFVADLIAYMSEHNYSSVEPTAQAQADWAKVNADLTSGQLQADVGNYLVHVRADGSKTPMAYAGGLGAFVKRLGEVAEADYEGFRFV